MKQITVGIQELKTELGRYVRDLQPGTTVLITEDGKPVGRLLPPEMSTEERVHSLVQAGLLKWSGRKPASIQPVARSRGPRTVADLLLEDRD